MQHTRALGRIRVGCEGHTNRKRYLWSSPPSYSLVIQYNIWSPDVVGRHVQLLYAPVLVGVPNQFVVVPKLKEREREKKKDKRINIRRGPGDWKVETRKGREGSAACNRLCLVRPAPCTMYVTPLGSLVGCGALLFVPVEVKEICIQMSTDKTIGDIILLKDPNE